MKKIIKNITIEKLNEEEKLVVKNYLSCYHPFHIVTPSP